MKILLAEDDTGICDFVIPELEHEGYETILAKTGREALSLFESENPDLLLLDIMLPELSGLEVLRRIRAKSPVPVILETARGETLDKINGLNLGADDYIAKPFDIEELLARINALFRRINLSSAQKKELNFNNLRLNTERMNCILGEKEIVLSKTEFLMLKFLMENQGKVLSRQQIIDEIWGKNHFIDENTVDVYIGYLRQKLQSPDGPFIKTVRGAGYLMS